MKQTKEIKLAYAAGLFDGEGCVRIYKIAPRNRRSTRYGILTMLTQKDGRPLDWLVGNFGGMIYLKNKHSENWIYEWRIENAAAYEFCKSILPFTKVKTEQLRLAIRFQERLKYARKKTVDDQRRFTSLSEHELEEREMMYQEMSFLKKNWQKSKNPNVKEYNFKSMVQL